MTKHPGSISPIGLKPSGVSTGSESGCAFPYRLFIGNVWKPFSW